MSPTEYHWNVMQRSLCPVQFHMRLAHKYSLMQGTCVKCEEHGAQVWQHREKRKGKDYCAECWLQYYAADFVRRNAGPAGKRRRVS